MSPVPHALVVAYSLAIFVGLPVLLRVAERWKPVRTIGPVILAYAVGMLLGNQDLLAFDRDFSLQVGSAAVALAIPLLLFSVDVPGWLRLAPATVLSFGLAVVSVTLASVLTIPWFRGVIPDVEQAGGMLAAVYVGGTVNMVSVGAALGVPAQTFVTLNAADMVTSTVHLLLVVSVAQRFLGLFLPPFRRVGPSEEKAAPRALTGAERVRAVLGALGLSVAVGAAGFLAGLPFEGALRDTMVIVALTSLAVGASFVPRVRAWPLTYETGFFCILVFCVAVGTTARFDDLLGSSLPTLGFTAALMTLGIVFHVALAALFRIDRDTVIITSTATIWAPPMVPPVAAAIRNRDLLGPGIATGLMGYAVATYVGLVVAWVTT